ncbi:hypothetical protein CS0771_29320 [Catellatospora sp. IY07-71]|nr:hypothetical protein CS0771_29320 [Catellatospora sp. IY07-71]
MAQVGQAHAGGEADITGADHADFHVGSLPEDGEIPTTYRHSDIPTDPNESPQPTETKQGPAVFGGALFTFT